MTFTQTTVSYVHAAVSMNPSAGVVRQMADEAQAASELAIDWTVWLCRASDLTPRWRRGPRTLQYAALRLGFYSRLLRLARRGKTVVLRHSAGDPFLFAASFFLGKYFTVHHTMEEAELAASTVRSARLQLWFERVLGRWVVARARGIICLTPEIARHQLARIQSRTESRVLDYPNGVLYPHEFEPPSDLRGDEPEVLFVASYFYQWHGLEQLLESMLTCRDPGILHLVGVLPDSVRSKAQRDERIQIHGGLDPQQLAQLAARCWLGLSSFDLAIKGMSEACTLKVRDYLMAGLPVYAGHRDSALPAEFKYFRQGPPAWPSVLLYAHELRGVERNAISIAARPFIDKKLLLERLHQSLEGLT